MLMPPARCVALLQSPPAHLLIPSPLRHARARMLTLSVVDGESGLALVEGVSTGCGGEGGASGVVFVSSSSVRICYAALLAAARTHE